MNNSLWITNGERTDSAQSRMVNMQFVEAVTRRNCSIVFTLNSGHSISFEYSDNEEVGLAYRKIAEAFEEP